MKNLQSSFQILWIVAINVKVKPLVFLLSKDLVGRKNFWGKFYLYYCGGILFQGWGDLDFLRVLVGKESAGQILFI